MEDSERVVVESLRWACDRGATALNYLRAEDLLVTGGRVAGVRALDRVTGRTHEFQAPTVVNAAGPWARRLAAQFDRDLPRLWRPTLAFNLALQPGRRPDTALAVAPRPPGTPTYFLVPWKEGVLAGTHHVAVEDGRRHGPTVQEVDAFKAALARAAPGLGLEDAPVVKVLWGWLPGDPGHRLGLATRPEIVDHGRIGGPDGLTSVVGVKFTTARAVAEATLRGVLGGPLAAASDTRPGPGQPIDQIRSLVSEHGWFAPQVQEGLRTVVREEAVVTAEDLVARRVAWSPFAEAPDLEALTKTLDLVPSLVDGSPAR